MSKQCCYLGKRIPESKQQGLSPWGENSLGKELSIVIARGLPGKMVGEKVRQGGRRGVVLCRTLKVLLRALNLTLREM